MPAAVRFSYFPHMAGVITHLERAGAVLLRAASHFGVSGDAPSPSQSATIGTDGEDSYEPSSYRRNSD